MITSVNYLLFPGAELFTFASRAIATVDAKRLQLPSVVPYLDNASVKCDAFQSALERESKNPVTKLQAAKSDMCNDAFMAFRSYCESASTRRKEGWSDAANTLLNVIRKHGWSAQHLGYKAKSGALNNIISEIRTKYPAELALIAAGELLDEVDDSQKDFEATAKQFVEVAAATNEPTVVETRPELVVALRALFQFVGLQQIAAPSADLTALTNELNALIVSSLSTLRATDTRAENKKKDTGKTDTSVAG
ncbi:MAG: DUF6261 family protein [Paludibacter sp.]|nr:DUF6261 family protein [Paludibacter sp.]